MFRSFLLLVQGVPFDLDLNPALNDNVNSEKLHLQHVLKQIFHR